MMTTLKKAFWNGTFKRFTFILGVLFLVIFLTLYILLPSMESILPASLLKGLYWIAYDISGVIGIVSFFGAFILLLSSFFLPNRNAKKHHYPQSAVAEGSDKYLDQDSNNFSKEEREAMLQESWMSRVEQFNRTRAK